MPRNYNEQLQQIVNSYIEAGETWPATAHQIAAWAIRTGKWDAQKTAVMSLCAEHLAQAMRNEYIVDPQGRTVRAKYAARGEQGVLWDDKRTATREHMIISCQQRRQQIVGDCRQLKTDVDSYNENENPGKPIQMVFDFTLDLAEIETLSTVSGPKD
mgnify:CR=1 FL=1